MRLKIGDKVRVLPGYKKGMDGIAGFSRMEKMAGQTFTLEIKVTEIDGMQWFRARKNGWNWSEEMLEPVLSKKEEPKLPML